MHEILLHLALLIALPAAAAAAVAARHTRRGVRAHSHARYLMWLTSQKEINSTDMQVQVFRSAERRPKKSGDTDGICKTSYKTFSLSLSLSLVDSQKSAQKNEISSERKRKSCMYV